MDTTDLRVIDEYTLLVLIETAGLHDSSDSFKLHFLDVAKNALNKTADFAKYYDEKGVIKI
jgi:hypothetical protein